MRSRRTAYVFLLLLLVAAEIYLNNKFSLILLCVGVFVPLVSVLLFLLSYKGLRVALAAADNVEKGETTEIKVILSNEKALSIAAITAVLDVTNTLTGESIAMPFESAATGRGSVDCVLALRGFGVGRLYLTVRDVRVYDAFKLVSFPLPLEAEETVFVLPRDMGSVVTALETREIEGESAKFSEDFAGNDPSEVYDIREYALGDDIRRIHWKLTGKYDSPMVKEFSSPQNFSVVLLTELIASTPGSIERCAEYTLNISKALLEIGVMHTLSWYDGFADEFVSLNITDFDVLENATLRFLASAYYDSGFEGLSRFMADTERNRNSTLIYITPVVDEERVEKLSLIQSVKVVNIREGKTTDWNLTF